MTKWYDDPKLVAGLGTALYDAEVLQDSEDSKNFLNKPYTYSEYYKAWEASGFPDSESENWDEFVNSIGDDEDEDNDEDDEDDEDDEE